MIGFFFFFFGMDIWSLWSGWLEAGGDFNHGQFLRWRIRERTFEAHLSKPSNNV
jgi:hypothetical protein